MTKGLVRKAECANMYCFPQAPTSEFAFIPTMKTVRHAKSLSTNRFQPNTPTIHRCYPASAIRARLSLRTKMKKKKSHPFLSRARAGREDASLSLTASSRKCNTYHTNMHANPAPMRPMTHNSAAHRCADAHAHPPTQTHR